MATSDFIRPATKGIFSKKNDFFLCKTKMKELTIFVDFRTNFQALIENWENNSKKN